MRMREICFALVLVAVGDTSLLAQPRRGDQPAGEYGWVFNLETGKKLARESGKPLMVVVRCVP